MANKKFSELDAVTSAASSDFLAIVASGASKKITFENLFKNIPDGTAATPGLAFADDADSGLYRSGSDGISMALGGSQEYTFSASNLNLNGNYLVGTTTEGGSLVIGATSNAVHNDNAVILFDTYYSPGEQGAVYIKNNRIGSRYYYNAHASLNVNEYGYAGGVTQYRSFYIFNGKYALITSFSGPDNRVTHAAGVNLCVNGAVPETGSTGTLSFKNGGTAPDAAVADQFQLYAADTNGAGTTGLGIYAEAVLVSDNDETQFNYKVPILYNGELVYLMAIKP